MSKYKVTSGLVVELVQLINSKDFETGGLLGSTTSEVIDAYWFDEGLEHSTKEFRPNIQLWEQHLIHWDCDQIQFCGIIHSHISEKALSQRDIQMARKIMKMNDLKHMLMPIFILSTKDLIWFDVNKDYVEKINVEIIKNRRNQP